jgi:hypothetical protein
MSVLIDAGADAALAWELAAISAFDGMARQIQADQYRRIQRAGELAATADGVTESSAPPAREMSRRSFVAELATTLGQHEASAARLVVEAERLTGPRSATLEALERGELALTQVRSVLEFTADVPAEVADAVEQVALDAASLAVERGIVSTNTDVRRRMRLVRERLHPEPLADRHARAVAERRMCLDPASDGMAWLSMLLEADRATAIQARFEAIAASEPANDARTTAQRAVDVAADLLLCGLLPDDARTRDAVAGGGAVPARVNVTVPALTLLGLDDEPGELEGYGPIDADTARRLAAHAPSLRRILVHPETGATLSYGRAHYRAPADLDGFVRVRDGVCRFPGCARRAERADLDHTTAWASGGQTSAANLAVLCRRHHRLKHESGWRVAHEPGGTMRWTSPAGHVLRTLPERPFVPVAVGGAVDGTVDGGLSRAIRPPVAGASTEPPPDADPGDATSPADHASLQIHGAPPF